MSIICTDLNLLMDLETSLNSHKAVDVIYFFSIADDMQEVRDAKELRK